MALVGLVRAEFLRGRNFEYVAAARALGVSNGAIMWRHLLPNAMVATLTFLPFILGGSITTLTSLDFLGFGLPPGSPSLGELLQQGKNNLSAPWLALTGFITHLADAVAAGLRRRGGARRVRPAKDAAMSALLEIENLRIDFRAGERAVQAVRGISFSLETGQTLALVGESGSGKSVTAASILKLLPPSASVSGRIGFRRRGPRQGRRRASCARCAAPTSR